VAATTYICNDEQHNKFWSFEVNGTTVEIKWGRIGLDERGQTKSFASDAAMQKFINSKVKEKIDKGYKEVTSQKLKEETKTAHTLGPTNKIYRMLWVSKKNNDLTQITKYDPKKYVYVEIQDSWRKHITRLLLAKQGSWELDDGITEFGQTISINGMTELSEDHAFAKAVRNVLKKMAEAVAEVFKTVKFAAVGIRNLSDDEDNTDFQQEPSFQAALAKIDASGFEPGVISKFASMGVRVLEL